MANSRSSSTPHPELTTVYVNSAVAVVAVVKLLVSYRLPVTYACTWYSTRHVLIGTYEYDIPGTRVYNINSRSSLPILINDAS